MAIRYVRFWAETPYTGTDFEEYIAVGEQYKESDLNELAEELSRANAESYEYLVTGWEDDEFEDSEEREEAIERYYEDCCCGWDFVSREEWEENEGSSEYL